MDAERSPTTTLAADQITLHYRSQLNNAEFNLVRTEGDLSLLGGFRYLSLNEDFNIRSTDLDTGTSKYHVHTTNNLFGGQLGTRFRRSYGELGWDATGKAGIFGNADSQSQSVTDFPPGFFLRDRRASSGGQVAFVGDINLSATYQLSDFWALRAGYNLLWWSDVLRPGSVVSPVLSRQQVPIDPTFGGPLNGPTRPVTMFRSSDFLAQGLTVGVVLDW